MPKTLISDTYYFNYEYHREIFESEFINIINNLKIKLSKTLKCYYDTVYNTELDECIFKDYSDNALISKYISELIDLVDNYSVFSNMFINSPFNTKNEIFMNKLKKVPDVENLFKELEKFYKLEFLSLIVNLEILKTMDYKKIYEIHFKEAFIREGFTVILFKVIKINNILKKVLYMYKKLNEFLDDVIYKEIFDIRIIKCIDSTDIIIGHQILKPDDKDDYQKLITRYEHNNDEYYKNSVFKLSCIVDRSLNIVDKLRSGCINLYTETTKIIYKA